MGANSKIGWTDHTFNPWIGCMKISPGCDNCYAAELDEKRFSKTLGGGTKDAPVIHWGAGAPRYRTKTWSDPIKWNKAAKALGVRQKVFCASLADWLDNQVPESWREDLACVIDATPHLDWLLLTKRPENLEKLSPWHEDDVPNNVWLGITAENQDRFNHRWRYLRDYAAIRFVSYEPGLEPLLIDYTCPPDWIICGAESGPHRRPFNTEWARDICNQCIKTGTAFFYKQDWIDGKLVEGPELDGKQWLQFPPPST